MEKKWFRSSPEIAQTPARAQTFEEEAHEDAMGDGDRYLDMYPSGDYSGAFVPSYDTVLPTFSKLVHDALDTYRGSGEPVSKDELSHWRFKSEKPPESANEHVKELHELLKKIHDRVEPSST